MQRTGPALRAILADLSLWSHIALAAEDVVEHGVLNIPMFPATPGSSSSAAAGGGTGSERLTLDGAVGQRQQHVQTLTAQAAALRSVLIMNPTGATLQPPSPCSASRAPPCNRQKGLR